MNKNLWIITASQIFSFTPAPVNVFLSGIIGSTLSPIKSLQTVPTSLMIVGIAVFSFFAAKIMSRIGRKAGFLYAALFSTLSVLMASYAVWDKNFYLFCLACFFIGNGMAFTHQYRFAAAESVKKSFIPKALSIIMLASIFSALLGPNIANFNKNLIDGHLFVGSYLSLAVLTFIPVIFLIFYSPKAELARAKEYKGRSYFELILHPRFLQAVVSAAFAYAVMSFLMTATPINMYVIENYSLNKTSIVIQLHIVSMFLPSLITGNLLKKYGHSKIIYAGVTFFILTILLSFLQPSFFNYLFSLVFLGIGWNFLYLSGTGLLVLSYREEEKFKAQGFNDILVFSTQALASLSAGYVLSMTSWKTMNLIAVPFLILIVLSSIRADLSKNSKLTY
jgi:MFS family permease|tara:strand:+ start:2147 stop:3322 length:1176 start_codon:yes stop_codon:yes gene_type:complete